MSALVRPQFTTIDGLSVRFAEGGQGDQDAILLSPWPESVYAFEPSWERLAAMIGGGTVAAKAAS